MCPSFDIGITVRLTWQLNQRRQGGEMSVQNGRFITRPSLDRVLLADCDPSVLHGRIVGGW